MLTLTKPQCRARLRELIEHSPQPAEKLYPQNQVLRMTVDEVREGLEAGELLLITRPFADSLLEKLK